MMKQQVGLIGCGNMGRAMARGLVRAKSKIALRLYDARCEVSAGLAQEFGDPHAAFSSLEDAVKGVQVVVLAVKPKTIETVTKCLIDIFSGESRRPLLISLAAGTTLGFLKKILGDGWLVARVMPNIACECNAGMMAIYSDNQSALAQTEELLGPLGRVVSAESDAEVDLITAMSGSSPAFVFSFIEALSDAGVKLGVGRDRALLLSAQSVFGAAAMVLESSRHPALLREMVTSPGGTTIAGLHELEKSGMRAGVISAVEAAARRAAELGKK